MLLILSLLACGGETPAPPATAPAAAPAVAPAPVAAPTAADVVTPAPPADAATAAAAGDAVHGKVVYDQFCLACHQGDGTGMGGALGANFRDDAARMARPDAELLHSINEGVTGKSGTMPPWKGTLSPQDQADALAFVRTFRK